MAAHSIRRRYTSVNQPKLSCTRANEVRVCIMSPNVSVCARYMGSVATMGMKMLMRTYTAQKVSCLNSREISRRQLSLMREKRVRSRRLSAFSPR